MAQGGDVGDFGGGWLAQGLEAQWLGAQRPGLFLGVPSCPEPQGARGGGTGAELGSTAKDAL